MKKYIRRALKSIDRLNQDSLHTLVTDLVEDNEQLEMILSSMPVGVVVVDELDRVSLLNNPARRLLPLATADPTERILWEVIALDDLAQYVRQALEEDRGAPMRDFHVTRRGIKFVISCGILTMADRGRIRGSMLYVEDVTEARTNHARLKRAEGLASLATMAAGIAHEIKNPLASMSIHLQLMRRKLNSGMVDAQAFHDTLTILEEETDRLGNIVSDYLFTVRPRDASPKPSDINAILADLVHFLRFELEEAGVRVVQRLDKDIPTIPLDESAMKRAMLNLVKNALEAMPDGGVLTIETRLERQEVVIIVDDTGCGIPEELQDKIFEPYFTTRDSGSGLGLTAVYKVVKDHTGDLQMNSITGRGTRFIITLPIPLTEQFLLSSGED